jgi:hypothetical protein
MVKMAKPIIGKNWDQIQVWCCKSFAFTAHFITHVRRCQVFCVASSISFSRWKWEGRSWDANSAFFPPKWRLPHIALSQEPPQITWPY